MLMPSRSTVLTPLAALSSTTSTRPSSSRFTSSTYRMPRLAFAYARHKLASSPQLLVAQTCKFADRAVQADSRPRSLNSGQYSLAGAVSCSRRSSILPVSRAAAILRGLDHCWPTESRRRSVRKYRGATHQ